MPGFTLETLDPPVQIPFPGGGGVSLLNRRKYTVHFDCGARRRVYVLQQQLGFLNAEGSFVSRKIEKSIALSAEAYALLDHAAFAAAPDNAARVAVIQKAHDAAPRKTPRGKIVTETV